MRLMQSYEFASGLRAVVIHFRDPSQGAGGPPLAAMREELCAIQFRIAQRLRSALFWIEGGEPITGSQQDQQVYYDTTDRAVLLDYHCTGEL